MGRLDASPFVASGYRLVRAKSNLQIYYTADRGGWSFPQKLSLKGGTGHNRLSQALRRANAVHGSGPHRPADFSRFRPSGGSVRGGQAGRRQRRLADLDLGRPVAAPSDRPEVPARKDLLGPGGRRSLRGGTGAAATWRQSSRLPDAASPYTCPESSTHG